jgi:ribosomal protein L10
MFIKNSLARKALDMRAHDMGDKDCCIYDTYKGGKEIRHGWEKLSENFRSVNGCIFTNGKMSKVAELLEHHVLASNG